MRKPTVFLAIHVLALTVACSKKVDNGADGSVTTKGTVEVTAQLEEIRDKFPPNDLYDYVYVLKYRILETHRGKVDGQTILVGHYNPLKPRTEAADERSGPIGGNVRKFTAGEIHRMALEMPIDDFYMGPMINKYHGEDNSAVYWAVWTNQVVR